MDIFSSKDDVLPGKTEYGFETDLLLFCSRFFEKYHLTNLL